MKSLAEQLDDQARTSVAYEKAKAAARMGNNVGALAEGGTFTVTGMADGTSAWVYIDKDGHCEPFVTSAMLRSRVDRLETEVARLRATLRALGFEDDLK